MGDMNGRTGRKNRHTVVRNFGEDWVKDNGQTLIESCTQTSLKIWSWLLIIKNIH